MRGILGSGTVQFLPGRFLAVLTVSLLALALLAPGVAAGTQTGEAPSGPENRAAPFIHPDVQAESVQDPTGPLEVIVTHRGSPEQATAAFDRLGLMHHTLERIGASLVRIDPATLAALAQEDAVRGIWPNEPIDMHLEQAGPIVNATSAREQHDVTGEGIGVLVIDTGVDGLHPDLSSRLVQNVQPVVPFENNDGDFIEDVPINDWFGHGTHVSGILAGTGTGLGNSDPNHGRFVGIAPGIDLVMFSLSSPSALDTPVGYTWTALNGFEYALEKQEEHNIRVISNSWGNTGEYAPDHPVSLATLKAYQEGMAVVFSAGNEGQGEETDDITLNRYATLEWTIGVAASDKKGNLADFSSRGQDPNMTGRQWDHPTITAPGDPVLAAKSRAGLLQALSSTETDEFPGEPVAQATHYQYARGTSMAAPMVAGAFALMLEANPELAPDQLYDILVATAKPFGDYEYWEAGAGMLDAHAAVEKALGTNGTRDAFLQGDRRYDEPFMHDEEPLKRHLFGELDDAPGPQDETLETETSPMSLAIVFTALAVAILVRRPARPARST